MKEQLDILDFKGKIGVMNVSRAPSSSFIFFFILIIRCIACIIYIYLWLRFWIRLKWCRATTTGSSTKKKTTCSLILPNSWSAVSWTSRSRSWTAGDCPTSTGWALNWSTPIQLAADDLSKLWFNLVLIELLISHIAGLAAILFCSISDLHYFELLFSSFRLALYCLLLEGFSNVISVCLLVGYLLLVQGLPGRETYGHTEGQRNVEPWLQPREALQLQPRYAAGWSMIRSTHFTFSEQSLTLVRYLRLTFPRTETPSWATGVIQPFRDTYVFASICFWFRCRPSSQTIYIPVFMQIASVIPPLCF